MLTSPPVWFGKPEAVPTWNFAVVHAGGRLKAVTDRKSLHDLLDKLVRKFENYDSSYDFSALPDAYKSGMMDQVIGFEMEIERLDGKSNSASRAARPTGTPSCATCGRRSRSVRSTSSRRRFTLPADRRLEAD